MLGSLIKFFRMQAMIAVIACKNPVSMEKCDHRFRDRWWFIEDDIIEDKFGNDIEDLSFKLDSDNKTLVARTYLAWWEREFDWECIDVNKYRIKGNGKAEVSKINNKAWYLDATLHGLVKISGKVTESPWCSLPENSACENN